MNKPARTRAKPRRNPPSQTAPAETAAAAPAVSPPPAVAAAAAEWRPFARIPSSVRWGDLDAFNHVNNAAYLVYVQEARLAWLAQIEGPWFDETMMPVVASAHMNYRRQLGWPAGIAVELAAARIGNSSITIAHRIVAEGAADCVYADGEVVMVWIDPSSGHSVPLPAAIRTACAPEETVP